MFSWCSELNEYSSEQVQWYLDSMNQLEIAYPNVIFIYITGNAQRDGAGGYNRYLRNQQIRNYCLANGKIIFDFGDLDSWWHNPSTENWEQNTYEYWNGTEKVTIPLQLHYNIHTS